MGPVSFERLDVGSSRDAAMRAAMILGQAGIRVTAVNEVPAEDGPRFHLVVGSVDVDRAHRALGAADAADDEA